MLKIFSPIVCGYEYDKWKQILYIKINNYTHQKAAMNNAGKIIFFFFLVI